MNNSKNKKKRVQFLQKVIWIGIGIILFLVLVFVIFSKVRKNNSPGELTDAYMMRYLKGDSELVSQIDYPFSDHLNASQKKIYQGLMKKQYEKMTYDITREDVHDTDAVVVVSFSVYDLKSAMEKANQYIEAYPDKFQKNGAFDSLKAIDYKLEVLKNYRERVNYSIEFAYSKQNKQWVFMDLSSTDLEKLDGVY